MNNEAGSKKQKFKITIDAFSGPFERLLLLIEKKKLEINKVSLAKVTDDFVSYVQEKIDKKAFDFKETAAFVQTASTLLLIKSKALIPAFALDDEEQVDVDDLEKKIKIYKIYSDLASILSDMFYKDILFKKKVIRKKEVKFRPSDNLNFDSIFLSLDNILAEAPKKDELDKKVIENQMSLSEVIKNISQRVKTFMKANFKELAIGKTPRDIAISFLAILELFRKDEVGLEQEEIFGDIFVENKIID